NGPMWASSPSPFRMAACTRSGASRFQWSVPAGVRPWAPSPVELSRTGAEAEVMGMSGGGTGALLRVDDGNRGHVDDLLHVGALFQHVDGVLHADEDGADRRGPAQLR